MEEKEEEKANAVRSLKLRTAFLQNTHQPLA